MLRRRGVIDPEQERFVKGRQILLSVALAAIDHALENTTLKHRKLTAPACFAPKVV